MYEKREWIKEYHTGVVGTIYHIQLDKPYITLKAVDKPYEIRVSMHSLRTLLS